MINHCLDWTHAYSHRLRNITPYSSTFAGEAATCAARLKQELSAGTLPFLALPFREPLEKALSSLLDQLQPFQHMVVLGIGGSALGARALQKAFYPQQDRPGHAGRCIWIADNIDALTIESWMQTLPPEQTVVVVISKSGSTIETLAQYFIIRDWLQQKLPDTWKNHLVMVTDETKGELRQDAQRLRIPTLPVPDHLGGRYSIFSAVGLLPAAFLGINAASLLRGAAAISEPLLTHPESLPEHPAWHLAIWNRELIAHNYSQLIFFSYIPLWNYVGAWFSQLWAESLGKEGKGSMPVPAVGVTDQHSVNQMFLDGPRDKGCLFLTGDTLPKGPAFPDELPKRWNYLQGKQFGDLLVAESLGTRMALVQSGVPLLHIGMQSTDEEALGRLMQLCMTATILTGWLLNINPIDQPAVELGKRLANAKLGAQGYTQETADLNEFLNTHNSQDNVQNF